MMAFDASFPDRIRGYYLFGSRADGSAVESSDLDCFIIFKGAFRVGEAEYARQISRQCTLPGSVSTDLLFFSEEDLLRDGHFRVSHASILVGGEDIRPRMPSVTFDAYLRTYVQAPYAYIATVLRRADRITYPLDYPNPVGEFYGYDRDLLPPGDQPIRNTKALVSTVCWAATLLIGLHAGLTVPTKSDSRRFYRTHVGDEWTPLIEAIYDHGKHHWSYLIPDDANDRSALRNLCRQTLAFENHYLSHYRDYLLREARSSDIHAKALAIARLGQVLYPDRETLATVREATTDAAEQVRRTASATLTLLHSLN